MVYKYETDECEIPFVDWTHRAFTPIPKATISDGGSGSSASGDVNVTVSCDCEESGRSVTPTPTPKTEEPKDEPVTEDPVKEPEEQPKEDEPKVEPEQPTKGQPTKQPIPQEEPKKEEPVWEETDNSMEVTPVSKEWTEYHNEYTSVMTNDYQDVNKGEVKDKQVKDTDLKTRDTNNKFLPDKGLLRTTKVERTDGSYDVELAVGGYSLKDRKAILTLSKSDIINKIIPQDKVTMVHGKFYDLKLNPTDGFFTIIGTADTEYFIWTGDNYHVFQENPEFYEYFVFHVKGE